MHFCGQVIDKGTDCTPSEHFLFRAAPLLCNYLTVYEEHQVVQVGPVVSARFSQAGR